MLLLILFIVCFIGCVIWCKKVDLYDTQLPAILCILFGIILFVYVIIIPVNLFDNKACLYRYEQDKAYIESVSNNTQLIDSERQKLNDLIISNNVIISSHRAWKDDIWIGILYSEKVANLKMFDIAKIKPAKMKAEIVITK